MGKVSSQVTELVEDYSPSLDTARVTTGERFRSSGVAAVASKVRPQDVGITTLKQNVALVERLRAVAIRSEPPPPPPVVAPVAVMNASATSSLADLDEPDADLDSPDSDLVERTSNLEPLQPIFRSKRKVPARPEPSVSQIVLSEPRSNEDGEPITNMLPPARRALERQLEQQSVPAAAPRSRVAVALAAAVIVVAAVAGVALHQGTSAPASHSAVTR